MTKDTHVASGKWEFDDEVTANFESMLAQSIPEYNTMRDLCFSIGQKYVVENSVIIDLGASRGDSVSPFIDYAKSNNIASTFKLVECSIPMLDVLKSRFDGVPNVCVSDQSISTDAFMEELSSSRTSLVLSILTLQFTPIEYRNHILSAIYDSLESGGIFIFVEKVIGNTSKIDKLFIDRYYSMKASHGYSKEQIERKRKALEGVLVPVTANYNEEMLKSAQFSHVDCFYRNLNFAGWVAIK